MTIETLRQHNANRTIHSVQDTAFARYGRVITDLDTTDILVAAAKKPMPVAGSAYEASTDNFECLPIAVQIADKCFGELPTQIGYCYGHNRLFNAWEWHTSSEINIATTDLVLILGDVRDMENNTIDASKAELFYLRKGEAVEVYATTLHFCPCEVEASGFGCVVALPKGTNLPLEKTAADPYLFCKNKWLIAHSDNAALIRRGAPSGISGENIEIQY